MKKLAYLFLFFLGACHSPGFERIEDGVIVRLDSKEGAPRMVKFQVVSDKIIHITATANKSFSNDTSLIVVKQNLPKPEWSLEEGTDTIILKTNEVLAKIALATAEVQFTDLQGNVILSEEPKRGKYFKPVQLDGKDFFEIRQLFQSPSDEAFFGLGQHQDGIMNYKGKNVELYQYNTKVSVPFVMSNKNYGILWDNYSITRFGDPRDYMPLTSLKTYDENGEEGGLRAIYRSSTDTNKIFITRQEEIINYEFIPDLDSFPATFPMGQGLVSWKGFIESDSTGLHNFRFYFAGYAKVWLNGKLVADRWRQCWNPAATFFSLDMKKGEKYPIHIEWNPDCGQSYIGLRCLTPQAKGDQEKLSLYSEIANEINYYFIKGNNADDVIKGYRSITGKAQMMPKWAMGYWQSRERYKTQEELLNVVKEYRKRNIPFDNIVLDWFYWPETKWGDHNFDSARFPDPKGMIADIHNKYNAHIMISVWPKFYEGSENYKKFNEKGWLYTKNIKDQRRDWVGQGYTSTFYDPFNAEARDLFWDLMNEKLFSIGIDAWWMDASEPDIHSNMNIADRKALMNPTSMGPSAQYFNAFPLMNAKGIYEGQRETNPDQRVFILTRSAYGGQQRYAAATWSGDIGARWEEMEIQISSGLNFCMTGIPYWTTDIGGFLVEKRFEKPNSAELEEWREMQARWFQYGAFCPLFRAHGQFPFREMFNIAPENHVAYKMMVDASKLRYKLMPYIYSLAGMVNQDDYTIMRGLPMDFNADPAVYTINNQFMFGPSLLINPVTKYKAREREVYLPKGNGWYHLFSGKYYDGGQTINAEAPLTEIPVFVKEGAIIPFGPEIQYAGQKSEDPIVIYVFTGKDGKFDLYDDEGVNYNYEKGQFSIIPVSYSESTKAITIGQRKGSFPGMDQKKKFQLVWMDKNSKKGISMGKVTSEIIEYTGSELIVKR